MNNSLAEVHPELVSEWSEKNLTLTPDDITFGSNKKVWWRGACGHVWQTSVKARSNGEKCPICSGARVIAGINDLATLCIHGFESRTSHHLSITSLRWCFFYFFIKYVYIDICKFCISLNYRRRNIRCECFYFFIIICTIAFIAK